jgi:hypothetical protein
MTQPMASAKVLLRLGIILPDSLRKQKFDGHVEVRVVIERDSFRPQRS